MFTFTMYVDARRGGDTVSLGSKIESLLREHGLTVERVTSARRKRGGRIVARASIGGAYNDEALDLRDELSGAICDNANLRDRVTFLQIVVTRGEEMIGFATVNTRTMRA